MTSNIKNENTNGWGQFVDIENVHSIGKNRKKRQPSSPPYRSYGLMDLVCAVLGIFADIGDIEE
jgi:hypothetical protein